MKKLFFLLLFAPAFAHAQVQHKKTNKWGWRTNASTGIIAGAKGTEALFQLSGGITYDRYFFGVGAGLDRYELRSIPLFADLRIDFLKTRAAFVYLNVGYTLPGDYDNSEEFYKTSDDMNGGLYFDSGLGYRIPLGGTHNLLFSAGYSQKRMSHEKVFTYPCGTEPCYNSPMNTYVYDYKFGRVIVKLAWEWGH